ncbi:MAG: ABC transporter permease [Promethearchaeota archaeon]
MKESKIENSIVEKIKNYYYPLGKKWQNSITKRMIILINKTMGDLYKHRGYISALVIMLFLPLFLQFNPITNTQDIIEYESIPIYSVSMILSFRILPFMFFWTLSLILSLLVSIKSAGIIADEVDRGTMLVLVSTPINRWHIFFGKYIAVFIYCVSLSFLSIFLIGWITTWISSGELNHFLGLLPFLGALFMYSLFVIFFFLNISMALSSILSKGRNVVLIVLFIIIIGFLGFEMIPRDAISFYESYYLYFFDLSYHLGNIFVIFVNFSNIIPSSSVWQIIFNGFCGVYKNTEIDSSQGIDLGGLELTGFLHPYTSLILLLGFTLLMLILGLYKLKNKEISN